MSRSKPSGEQLLQIGAKVRQIRKRAGLSLDQLANLSGVSKAMLSQIEQNKANPTVAVIWKIAQALNLAVSDLVEGGMPKRRFQVIRKQDERYLFASNERCTIHTLSPLSLEKDIEFYQIDFEPNGSLDSEPHFRNTEEILVVTVGKVKICSGDQEVTLQRGDSVYYSADVNHSIINPAARSAQAFLVVKYRAD